MQSVAGTKSAVAPAMAARPQAARPKAVAAQASIARPSFAKRVAQRGLKASRVESQRVVVVRASDDKVNSSAMHRLSRPRPPLRNVWYRLAINELRCKHDRARKWPSLPPPPPGCACPSPPLLFSVCLQVVVIGLAADSGCGKSTFMRR